VKRARPEQALHIAAVRWCELVLMSTIVFHPYNGGYRTRAEASIGKALGVRAGVGDLVLIWRGGLRLCVGFIEFKAPGAKVRQTDHQKAFQADCEFLAVPYAVVQSIEELDAVTREWGVPRRSDLQGAAARPAPRPTTGGSYVTGVRKRAARRRRAAAVV
jgi:hypothetical protein